MVRAATARRSRASASPCLPSLALATANQALLSTKTRLGAGSSAAVCRAMFRHVGLAQMAIEVLAHVGREPLEHAAHLENRIIGSRSRQRTDGQSNGTRLRPPALTGPALEPGEIPFVQVHLDRPRHDVHAYRVMSSESNIS